MDVDKMDETLIQKVLREIDTQLSKGVLPVHNGHLEHLFEAGDVLDYLLFMKEKRLISGDVVVKGSKHTPFRMTNIRLTYVGIKALRYRSPDF